MGIGFDIPWGQPDAWREIHRGFSHLFRLRSERMEPVRAHAERIVTHLETLFPIMADLCERTCPDCREPCCRVATLWHDFQDLLFLHAAGLQIPNAQPMDRLAGGCRHLGERGCTLPRMSRPFICTWYVCPPQTRVLRITRRIRVVDEAIEAIKRDRGRMEDAFISAVSR